MREGIKTIFVFMILLFLSVTAIQAARLPVVGQDQNSWGNVLNDFLLVQHNQNGTLRNITILGTGTTVLTVDGLTNNVGVGTLSPSEKLTVIGNVNISGYLNLSGDLIVNNKFNITASSGNVNVAGTLDAANLRILGSNVQVEETAFNFANNLSSILNNGSIIRIGNASWAITAVNNSIKDYYNHSIDLSLYNKSVDLSGYIPDGSSYQLIANAWNWANNETFVLDNSTVVRATNLRTALSNNTNIKISQLNVTQNISMATGNSIFLATAANRRIFSNETCMVIEGPTSKLALC